MNSFLTRILCLLPLSALLGSISLTHAQTDDFTQYVDSPVWQLRYSVANEFKVPSSEARAALEKLSMDSNPVVAMNSFSVYSRLFVDINRKISDRAFERGEFSLVGFDPPDPREPETWILRLKLFDSPTITASNIRALGLCGDESDVHILAELVTSENLYVLSELAVAYRRLGSNEKYLETIQKILALPVANYSPLPYQNLCVGYLLQTHPDLAKTAWQKIDEQIKKIPDMQANWVYAHVRQKELFELK